LYLNRLYEQKAVMVLYGLYDRLTERMEGGGGQSGTVSHDDWSSRPSMGILVGELEKKARDGTPMDIEKPRRFRRSGSLVPVEVHVLCTTAMFLEIFSSRLQASSLQESRCNSSPRRSNKGQILSLSHIYIRKITSR
jgi:hypothetical protein